MSQSGFTAWVWGYLGNTNCRTFPAPEAHLVLNLRSLSCWSDLTMSRNRVWGAPQPGQDLWDTTVFSGIKRMYFTVVSKLIALFFWVSVSPFVEREWWFLICRASITCAWSPGQCQHRVGICIWGMSHPLNNRGPGRGELQGPRHPLSHS